jgi:hypothetical protein
MRKRLNCILSISTIQLFIASMYVVIDAIITGLHILRRREIV